MIDEEHTELTDNPTQFCIDIILKEAKREDMLVKQLIYTMLSAYTNNPINLAVNSPSGEGKNYVINKVGDNFPKEDVMFLAGMTDKALFHRQGTLVIKNGIGEYESVDCKIAEIDSEIADKESEIENSKDGNFKKARREQIKQLEQQKKDLYKDAKKLIELSHKILVFLDTPRPELFDALMPLLSHDKYEVEYEFVDTHNGIKTKINVLRGWPAVIFAQAIDYSYYKRWPEIRRRFIFTNPKMTTEKYAAAIDLIFDKFGLPDFMYQLKVVSNQDKQKVRQIIADIKERILYVCDRIPPGTNNVFDPFSEVLERSESIKKEKAFDMTTANRFGTYLTLLPLININKHPTIQVRKHGDPIFETIPLALFEDLKESLFLMEYAAADSIRPYILEWYRDVFLAAYNEANELPPRSKVITTKKGEQISVSENIVALTTDDLVKKTKKVYNRNYTKEHIRDTYIYPLSNQGYIDNADSEIDGRAKIYYPLIIPEESSANANLHDKDRSYNFIQQSKTYVKDPALYPSKEYITSQIQPLLQYMIQSALYKQVKILDHEGMQIADVTIEQKEEGSGDSDQQLQLQLQQLIDAADNIVDRYYNNPEDYFHIVSDDNGESDLALNSIFCFHSKKFGDMSAVCLLNGSNRHDNRDDPKNTCSKNVSQNSHIQNAEIASESQQNLDNNIENTTQSTEQSRNLHEQKAVVQSCIFPCYYCNDYQSNDEMEYRSHVALKHPEKPLIKSIESAKWKAEK
jgi:hypothetical protein